MLSNRDGCMDPDLIRVQLINKGLGLMIFAFIPTPKSEKNSVNIQAKENPSLVKETQHLLDL